MLRGTATLVLAVALGAACSGGAGKKGPPVAKGNDIVITADEFKARLDEQSPFIRQRYTTLERKKEFLDGLIRFELLARAAQKQGLDKDPDVLQTVKKVMVQKLVQKTISDGGDPTKEIPEADQKKFYEDHRDDYNKPKRVRLSQIFITAAAGAPERAAKSGKAKQALSHLKAEEKKKTPNAFAAVARDLSEDAASKGIGGDLGFKSEEELTKLYGKPFGEAVFAMKDNDTSLLDSPQGFHVVRVTAHQDAVERTFDQVKMQIASRLSREKRQKEFDAYVKKLRDEAQITVVDSELEKVPVSTGPGPGMAGPHSGMPGHGGMGAAPPRPVLGPTAPQAASQATPAAPPAAAAAPAKK